MKHNQTISKIRLVLFLAALATLMLSLPYTFNRGASAQQSQDLQPKDASPTETPQPSPTLDDRFAQIARLVPSFGGFFIQDERLNVYLTDTTQLPSAMQAIVSIFGRDRLPLDNPVAVQGRFNFTQLKSWHDSHRLTTLGLPGVQSVDIDEQHNRLQIDVFDYNAFYNVQQELEHLNIPAAAFNISVVQPPEMMTGRAAKTPLAAAAFMQNSPQTLQSQWRPVAGGIQISNSNNGLCTLSFLAVRQNQAGFVTCSHCTLTAGGSESSVIYQPTFSSKNRIGVETVDPNYFTGNNCPAGRKCRYSDSAFIKRDSTNDQVTPLTPGNFGTLMIPLLLTIPPGQPILGPVFNFPIVSKADYSVSGEALEKAGRTTGHTQGLVNGTCVDQNAVSLVNGQQVDTGLTLLCQDKFSAVASGGDSGSPVFKFETAPDGTVGVKLYGIAWTSTGQETWFSPISQMLWSGELGSLKILKSENPNSHPEVKLLSPLDGSTVPLGLPNPVTLTAAGVDFEDSNLNLVWTTSEDGVLGTGPSLTHSFTTPGLRHLSVSTKDSAGNPASYNVTITVAQNTAPTVTINDMVTNKVLHSIVVHTNESFNLGSTSSDPNEPGGVLPCNNLTWSYKPTFGFSVPVSLGAGCHRDLIKFANTGDYTITLVGIDSLGAKGSAQLAVKVIEIGAPKASILAPTDSALTADQTATLTGTGLDPDTNNPISFEWDISINGVRKLIKTGSAANGSQFSTNFKPADYFAPFTCGTQQVTIFLTVTDSAGMKTEVSQNYFILFGPC